MQLSLAMLNRVQLRRYIKLALLLLIYTITVYHLIDYDNFPLSPNYQFPFTQISTAYFLSLFGVIAAEWYFQSVFNSEVDPKIGIKRFIKNIILCAFILCAIAYVLLSNFYTDMPIFNAYYLVISLLLTMINAAIWIAMIYGKVLLNKWTKLPTSDSINIKSDRTIHKIEFSNLSHFTSTNKVVIANLTSGKQIITNFNLTELENLLPGRFFRINRQFILNKEAIDQVKSIENQKLQVSLKDLETDDAFVVSRYRASEFKRWLN